MTRFASIHESTTYEVTVRGIKSRAEAEAIVLAVERMPGASAWIPRDDSGRANVEACPVESTPEPPHVPAELFRDVNGERFRSVDGGEHWFPVETDPGDVLKNGEAHA